MTALNVDREGADHLDDRDGPRSQRPLSYDNGNLMKLAFFPLLLIPSLAADSQHIIVIAHRGEHLSHTENSLAAFQAAADAGADYFECDVRTTKDGKLVLMHDGSVNRTTTGTGLVAQMSFDEVRALQFKPAGKSVTASAGPIPAFEEALALAKKTGIGIYVDVKSAAATALVETITRHGMQDRVVIYAGKKLLVEITALAPQMKAMPEARNAETLADLFASLPLKVVAFDARDFTDELIAATHERKALVYVDRLGPADNPKAWDDAVKRGADGIQTDHPAELVAFLKARGLR